VVTRCGPVVTTPELVERRAYTWTAPFAQGVDLVHQVTDVLGIAVAGRDGNRVMGLGFPDQTLVWDATAIEATNRVLLEAQLESDALAHCRCVQWLLLRAGPGRLRPARGAGVSCSCSDGHRPTPGHRSRAGPLVGHHARGVLDWTSLFGV
jgi:hypothetical protein